MTARELEHKCVVGQEFETKNGSTREKRDEKGQEGVCLHTHGKKYSGREQVNSKEVRGRGEG